MRNTYKPIHPAKKSRPYTDQLRDYLLCPEQRTPELTAQLRRNASLLLRQLAEQDDMELLERYLHLDFVTSEQCRRFLLENEPKNTAARILLMRASARSGPAASLGDPLTAGSEPSPSADIATEEKEIPEDPAADSTHLCQQYRLRLSIREPSLRIPLNRMQIRTSAQVRNYGTDGSAFFVNPQAVGRAALTLHDFQHMVIHCLFRHTQVPSGANAQYWHVAADLAAEYLCRKIFPSAAASSARPRPDATSFIYSEFPNGLYPGNAAAVYEWLCQNRFGAELMALGAAFCHDDHSPWTASAHELYTDSDSSGESGDSYASSGDGAFSNAEIQLRREEMAKLWQAAQEMQSTSRRRSRRGFAPGSREEKMILREEAQFDFRRYLRRFAVIREELQLDMDSFDYIPYYYGFQTYGNMPLLEPLEYTEAFKIEQLVIAIDTSGSCDTETVRRFLAEVQGILTDHENFFRKMEVHILQCDSYVHEHKVIHSVEEWDDYIENITIKGRGGTDFTPVFRFVDELRSKGQCRRLKGLLYFTDGDGVYPRQAPDYETAFIFSTRDFLNYSVPEWIVRLCLETAY